MLLIWILFIVLLDQYTKYLAVKKLKGQPCRDKLGFRFCYVENYGAAMGFMKKWPGLLKVSSLVLILALAYYLMASYLEGDILRAHILATILAGGIGNVMDRFTRGYVVDFFSPKIKKLPYFNIADFFVISACLLLVITEFNV